MDFSDESYVRLYTRDTTSWLRLGWEGQCVVGLMLRKLDRAGTLDLDGLEPWEAVKLQLNCPEEAARKGIAAALRVGVFSVVEGRLVAPNYIEAQTCAKSDRLRQQESRAKRAAGDDSRRPPPDGHDVTDRDSGSQKVTGGHAEAAPVTNGHSLLSSSVLGSTVREGERASAPPPPRLVDLHDAAPRAPRPVVGSPLVEELRGIVAAEADRMGFRRTPHANDGDYAKTAAACLEMSRKSSGDFSAVALEVAQIALAAHRDKGRAFTFALLEANPGAPAPVANANGKDTVASVRAELQRAIAAGDEGLCKTLMRKLDHVERQLPENQPKWGNHGR